MSAPTEIGPGVWVEYDAHGGFVGRALVERVRANGRIDVLVEYKSGKLTSPGACWFEANERDRLRISKHQGSCND